MSNTIYNVAEIMRMGHRIARANHQYYKSYAAALRRGLRLAWAGARPAAELRRVSGSVMLDLSEIACRTAVKRLGAKLDPSAVISHYAANADDIKHDALLRVYNAAAADGLTVSGAMFRAAAAALRASMRDGRVNASEYYTDNDGNERSRIDTAAGRVDRLSPAPEAAAIGSDLIASALDALAAAKGRRAAVVFLLRQQGYTLDEAAAALGVGVKAVRLSEAAAEKFFSEYRARLAF